MARYKTLRKEGHFDAARQVLGADAMYRLSAQAAAFVARQNISDPVFTARAVAAKTDELALDYMKNHDESVKRRHKRRTPSVTVMTKWR